MAKNGDQDPRRLGTPAQPPPLEAGADTALPQGAPARAGPDDGVAAPRFRYLSGPLAGPWRASRGEAITDAIEAKQAVRDTLEPDGVRWVAEGSIQKSGSGLISKH